MTDNKNDPVELIINGRDITEKELHVIYAIGRRGFPTRTDIASQLTKVGIDKDSRIEIIDALEAHSVVVRHKKPAIGQRGTKEVKYTLTLIGESFYKKAFGKDASRAGCF